MEGSQMFEEMNIAIQNDTIRLIMKANISASERLERKSAVKNLQEGHGGTGFSGQPSVPAKNSEQTTNSATEITPREPVKRDTQKVGRNDMCPCGSGKKYKNCCGKE